MNATSRILLDAKGYVVCVTRAGLTIQNKRTGKGRLIVDSDPAYAEWVDAIATAMDDQEAADLAAAIYRGNG